ncbi:hypothetical protein CPB84DRAFT_1773554 [Gymnopilus junonius]|uniref:Uncharacterized protein n=1 Tax=Gymnopilus junonius TaxID=109634 RepID=A0A9P5NPE7_GYMJU|nr:hypothetical protein CPB84DRAFT_1773554 [Gymnopilus junonius]
MLFRSVWILLRIMLKVVLSHYRYLLLFQMLLYRTMMTCLIMCETEAEANTFDLDDEGNFNPRKEVEALTI